MVKLYAPESLVNTLVTTPVPLFLAEISTPGNTAPVPSCTVPLTVALVD